VYHGGDATNETMTAREGRPPEARLLARVLDGLRLEGDTNRLQTGEVFPVSAGQQAIPELEDFTGPRKASARSTSARLRRISRLASTTACLLPSTTITLAVKVIRYGNPGDLSSLLYRCLFYLTDDSTQVGKVLSTILELQVLLEGGEL
jgi:hypothetical protein